MKTIVKNKRPFILLEVLIALAIVAICAIPLMSGQAFIFQSEKKFVDQLEMDRFANFLFSYIVEQLYENQIPWSSIDESEILYFESLKHFPKRFPYRPSYQFHYLRKPKKDENVTYALFNLTLHFAPTTKSGIPLNYTYALAIERQLAVEKESEKETTMKQSTETK